MRALSASELLHGEAAAAAARIVGSGDLVGGAVHLASSLADRADDLGTDSLRYFATLAGLACTDLTVARVVEPHLDALTILAQADHVPLDAVGAGPASTWGVFAANAPGHGLQTRHSESDGAVLRMDGSKAWCSLADRVSHALVTAATPDGGSALYAIPLQHPGVEVDSRSWVSRGLAELTTSTITCTDVPAVAVGGDGWYLRRPGFAWGGIAVAAVWYGGALALAEALHRAAGRKEPDQVALMLVGQADLELESARLALESAASDIDAGRAEGMTGTILALRTRSLVAGAAERIIGLVGHGLGPGLLTQDEAHARRVADLTVYIRQHHAERDLAVLGGHLISTGDTHR